MRFNEFRIREDRDLFHIDVPKGRRGPEVRDVQQALLALGYSLPKHGADGIRGPETVSAIKAFQTDNKITVDGDPGPETVGKLNDILKGKPEITGKLVKSLPTDVKEPTRRSFGSRSVEMNFGAMSGYGKPSDELIQFVKQKEGFSPKAFWDYKQYTNGYGTRANSSDEVIDEKEADHRLREKAQEFYNIVVKFDHAYKYGFNDNQLNALTSFVFNGGPGWLDQVSANGKRSKEQIAQAMLNYNTAGGQQLPGLVSRRRQEVAMFNAGSDKNPSSNMA